MPTFTVADRAGQSIGASFSAALAVPPAASIPAATAITMNRFIRHLFLASPSPGIVHPAAGGGKRESGGAEPSPRNGLDYQMLKPAELGAVEKLAILILSDTHGAATREVNPPRE